MFHQVGQLPTKIGRSCRRGNSLSTVLTTVEQIVMIKNYANPEKMVSGLIPDPKLTLDNIEIVKDIAAHIISKFQQEAILELTQKIG